jgi:ABC-2 type transport system ATP-binding protein
MIEVSHLTRRYGDLTAVDDVNFVIGRGEVVGLLGHNGAGKTTIMKMMTGFLEPSGGTIRIDGLEIGRDTPAIQSRLGYLPENCPVWPDMAVIDYLDYQATLHGVSKERRPRAIAQAIRRTALSEKATRPIHTLSRGYRQRVGVAQAILHEPDIIILDEPTNGLDPTQIRHMRELVRELATKATVIVSTHILPEVQAICERVLILRAGRLVIDSRLENLQLSHALLVTVEGDARAVLESIADVARVTELTADETRRQYRLDAPPAVAPRVAATLAQARLGVHELRAERHDLETVFARVNEEAGHA